MRYWCEFCRDPYDIDHFDANGQHRVGHEFGPEGSLLLAAAIVRDLAEVQCPVDTIVSYVTGDVEGLCPTCDAVLESDVETTDHDADCPWRRAKEWVERQGT